MRSIFFNFNLQKLIEEEQQCENPTLLFQNHAIHLGSEDYDMSASEVSLSVIPDDQTWIFLGNMGKTIVGHGTRVIFGK